jgi:hypothetical protein
MIIRIEPDGSILLIHHTQTVQKLARVLHGQTHTRRASHVEPIPHIPQNPDSPNPHNLQYWNVDLRPILGPASLDTTFATREEALQAEVLWIETNVLSRGLHTPKTIIS